MSPHVIVMLVVLVDLMGFTIVMPLLTPLGESRGYSLPQIGVLFGSYSLCQLVAGPILGRLSDRYGRRPILAISQGGTALSFVILGLSNSYGMMLFGRMLDGASGGNILVAQAYMADVTKPEHRARSMGMIGAAFGIGFVLGPLLAALLLKLPISLDWRLRVPFLVAAGFSTLAWILVLLRLPESLPADAAARQGARVVSWRGVIDTVADRRIFGLVAVGALSVTAFAALEGTFTAFLERRMHWPKADRAANAAYAFVLLGFVSALIQGGLIRRLVPKFGEPRLIVCGLAILALGMAAVAGVGNLPTLIGAIILVGIGHGLSSPTIQGLLSRITPASEQGAIFGTLTAAQTLARTLNYPAANVLLERYGPSAPYWEAAAIAGLTLILALGVIRLTSRRGEVAA